MSINITIYSDFVCPFCYVGSGMLDHFRGEFDIRETWVPHELHPDTPARGRDITELASRFDIDHITEVLRQRGAPYGIEFADMTRLSNSRPALESAEFARNHGGYHRMHKALFKAYFTDGRDIGDRKVLLSVAQACGLDPDELDAALSEGRYAERLDRGSAAAREAGVTAIPAFVFEGRPPLIGAVAEPLFREALQEAARGPLQGLEHK